MAMFRNALYLALVVLIAPYVYDRYVGLSTMMSNRPGKMQPVNNFSSYEIKFHDRIRNCEDILLEEDLGIAFLSCDPGRDRWNTVMGTFQPPSTKPFISNNGKIWLYNYSRPNLPSKEALRPLTFTNYTSAEDFHPLGIDYDATTSKLYVINHRRKSGSVIDIFQINIRSAQARHIRTFKHGLVHAPNAIHLLGDGKMFITNNHYIRAKTSPLLAKIETFSGIPGGTVVYTDINSPSSTKVVARVGFANGITMLSYKGTKTLAVASSSKPGVYFYTVKDDWDLEYKNWIRTPAGADNLSVDMNGKLLLAGHPYAPALMEVAKGRAQCDEEGSEVEKKACGCWAPSWAGEWSKEGGLKTLLLDDANGKKGVCSSSTVVRDVKRGVGVISMLYGKGLVVFKE